MGGKSAVRRIGLEILGWILVVLGIAALILPGPGLLGLFAGLAILSQRYEWAERRVRPVEKAAKKAAAQSVQTWPRIIASCLGVIWLVGLGIVWGLRPDPPGWWPVEDRWWLLGGWGTGATMIVSAFIALAMIVYSFRTYRGLSDEEIEDQVDKHSESSDA